jgi:type I restriction enzyme, S subunit
MSDELPEGWAAVPLGDLVRPSKDKAEPGTANGRPYLGMEHVESETGRVLGHGDAREVRSTTAAYRAGDVLYGKLRPYLNKVLVAPFDGVGSTEFIVFSQQKHIDSRYLRWLLARREFVETANERAAGVQLPRVTFDKLADLELPIAPLAEQRRIVAKVEALMEQVRRAKDRLDRAPVILKRFRQAVLAAACSGDLSATWRAASGRLDGNDPHAWHRMTVEEVASPEPRSIQSGPFGSNLLHSEFQTEGRLVIGIDNVGDGTFLAGRQHRISEGKFHELAKYQARPLDVLITVMATVGRCCVVPADIEPAIITKHVYRISCNRTVMEPRFLLCALRGSPELREDMRDQVRGQTRPGINGSILKGLEVPVPPLEEQAEIVRRVDCLFALATAIEQRVERAAARAASLPQAILSKAFAGELVPTETDLARAEGRDYETAAQLLQRVARNSMGQIATSPRRSRAPMQ